MLKLLLLDEIDVIFVTLVGVLVDNVVVVVIIVVVIVDIVIDIDIVIVDNVDNDDVFASLMETKQKKNTAQ